MGVWNVRHRFQPCPWLYGDSAYKGCSHPTSHNSNTCPARYCRWAAYNGVAQLPGVQNHSTVNHSIEFTTPTGVHTNHIESYWNRAKVKLKRMRGCHRSQLPSYLDEFMWRERYGKKNDDVLDNLYRDIALWFPV